MHAACLSAPGSASRQRVTLHHLALVVALLPFLPLTMAVESGCTAAQEQAAQQAFKNTTQTLADAIRRVENTAWTPAQFDAFVENYVALIPACQPYIKDAELAYKTAYATGNLSVAALEAIATKYDVAVVPAASAPAAVAVTYAEPPCEALSGRVAVR